MGAAALGLGFEVADASMVILLAMFAQDLEAVEGHRGDEDASGFMWLGNLLLNVKRAWMAPGRCMMRVLRMLRVEDREWESLESVHNDLVEHL
jgi:hypothetical protein